MDIPRFFKAFRIAIKLDETKNIDLREHILFLKNEAAQYDKIGDYAAMNLWFREMI